MRFRAWLDLIENINENIKTDEFLVIVEFVQEMTGVGDTGFQFQITRVTDPSLFRLS